MIKFEKVQNFWSRVSLKIRRDIIRLLGVRSKENFFLDSPIVIPRNDVERIGIYAKPETFVVPHLIQKGDMVTYSFQRRYIYEIPNAIIDPITGLVYDQHGKFIAESSAWEPIRLLSEIPRPRIKIPSVMLKGTYVFLPTTPTYYHWLMQDLPVFLGAHRKMPDAKILVGAHDFKPVQTFIDRYFPEKTVKCQAPVQVERLIMAAKDGGLGNPFPPHTSVNPRDIKMLKKWFEEYMINNQDTNDKGLMLYLSRSRWSRTHEGEIALEKELEKIGFTIFHGDLDLFEQIELFSKARLIFGASGAAMSNLTWVPSKTTVVQMRRPREYYHFYYNLGKICDLNYHFLEVPEGSWGESDINHIISKVKEIINHKEYGKVS